MFHLEYFNFLFLFFGVIFCTLLSSVKNFFNATYTTLKNSVFFFYTISFMLFMLQTTLFLADNSVKNSIYNADFAGIIIIFLLYIVGFVSLVTLGDRFWVNNYKTVILFLIFPAVVILMIKSTSMLQMFIYYELLLLPSVFFVHSTAYTRRSQQANTYFFLWTQLGSLISLIGVGYLIKTVGTTNFNILHEIKLSKYESTLLYSLFFFGFGVKVPIWPFHFWLTKVHVEAPSGFSIFLSGFLVKTAVYCFYKFTCVINDYYFFYVFPVFCLVGMLDGSIKMWGQIDIKKMIAYATVQEMNGIYILFNLNDNNVSMAGFVFLLAHGLLSSLMFYLIELLYKRTHSRSIYKVTGISELYPNLSLSVWFMLILFFGFPGTIKFFAEFYLLLILSEFNILLTIFVAFIFIFLGTLGFAKNWFSILYGHPGNPTPKIDLTKEEIFVVLLLSFLSIFCCFLLNLI